MASASCHLMIGFQNSVVCVCFERETHNTFQNKSNFEKYLLFVMVQGTKKSYSWKEVCCFCDNIGCGLCFFWICVILCGCVLRCARAMARTATHTHTHARTCISFAHSLTHSLPRSLCRAHRVRRWPSTTRPTMLGSASTAKCTTWPSGRSRTRVARTFSSFRPVGNRSSFEPLFDARYARARLVAIATRIFVRVWIYRLFDDECVWARERVARAWFRPQILTSCLRHNAQQQYNNNKEQKEANFFQFEKNVEQRCFGLFMLLCLVLSKYSEMKMSGKYF